MHGINYVAALGISIYHSFHDEVDAQRKHVWQCSGPCKLKSPYFGQVKRAMNRAPSPRDPWWNKHMRECGGTYVKVSEPPEFTEKVRKKEERKRKREERERKKKEVAEQPGQTQARNQTKTRKRKRKVKEEVE